MILLFTATLFFIITHILKFNSYSIKIDWHFYEGKLNYQGAYL